MSANNDDRRVRRTKKAIYNAFTTLLAQKSVNQISVSEITELADINRGTFYLHYRDVYDLLEQTEDELLMELFGVVDSFADEVIIMDPEALFEKVYELCGDNASLVKVLVSEHGDIRFLHRMKGLLREKCLKNWGEVIARYGSGHFEARYAFVVGGCIELVQYWFENGQKETPRELGEISGRFIRGLTAE